MYRKKRLPSQMANELCVSQSNVSRWLSGYYGPSIKSCHRLADYAGVSINEVLAVVGYIPGIEMHTLAEWPEFREYAQKSIPMNSSEKILV